VSRILIETRRQEGQHHQSRPRGPGIVIGKKGARTSRRLRQGGTAAPPSGCRSLMCALNIAEIRKAPSLDSQTGSPTAFAQQIREARDVPARAMKARAVMSTMAQRARWV